MNRLRIFAVHILLSAFPIFSNIHKTADLIVFSYNRPLQLHAFLTSVKQYVTHINKIFVIYRASSHAYEKAYQEVHAYFKDIDFIIQGSEPKKDFKPITLNCLYKTDAPYIIFATDDDLFKDYVDVTTCIQTLEKTQAYAFYLRLGMHITNSYMQNLSLALPQFKHIDQDMLLFSLQEGKSYWASAHNLDMTIYKKSKIEEAFVKLSYYSPNILESRWARLYPVQDNGLCFISSKGINIPLNLVQDDWHNKHEELFSAQQLLDLWNDGYQMDIEQFYKIENASAHMAYKPTFIKRKI